MSSYTNDAKPSITTDFLLKEDSYYLLLETGDKIVLYRGFDYTNDSRGTNSYTNDTKPS